MEAYQTFCKRTTNAQKLLQHQHHLLKLICYTICSIKLYVLYSGNMQPICKRLLCYLVFDQIQAI